MAGGTTADETKKAVCKAFTTVVKSSALSLDPKAFFMMLNTNYAVLVQDRRMDLGPLWDAMASQHPVEQLFGVFLMFRMRAMDLGLQVLLPTAVDALSEDQMRQALQPWTGVMLPDEPTPYVPEDAVPIPLNSGDLKPFVPEETRRQIVQIVSTAIRKSSIGAQFDAAQLTFQIDSAFDSLFDGRTFDLAQIFDVLRQNAHLDDGDVYRVVARVKIELTQLSFGVLEPAVSLNAIEKQNIIDDVRREDERASKQRSTPPPDIPQKSAEEPAKRTAEARLKEYGFESVNERKKKAPIVRMIALGLIVVITAVVGILTRPNRGLDHEHYASIVPVKSAELVEGTFQCVVDEAAWLALAVDEREKRLAKFQAMLIEEGFVEDMQCRDSQKRLVITAVGPNRIAGAAFFMKGDATGVVPKPEVAGKR